MKELKKQAKREENFSATVFFFKGKAAKSPTLSPPRTRSHLKTEIRKMELESSTNFQYRIVNWPNLCKQLDSCRNCEKGPLNLQNVVSERGSGLVFNMKIECNKCHVINGICTDEIHED